MPTYDASFRSSTVCTVTALRVFRFTTSSQRRAPTTFVCSRSLDPLCTAPPSSLDRRPLRSASPHQPPCRPPLQHQRATRGPTLCRSQRKNSTRTSPTCQTSRATRRGACFARLVHSLLRRAPPPRGRPQATLQAAPSLRDRNRETNIAYGSSMSAQDEHPT